MNTKYFALKTISFLIACLASHSDHNISTSDFADNFNSHNADHDNTTIAVAVVLTFIIVFLSGIIAILVYKLRRRGVKGIYFYCYS